MKDALINLDNSKRFRILKKCIFTFQSGAGVSGAYNEVTLPFEYYRKLNIPIDYSSTTGAIAEVKSNNIFWIMGAASSNHDDKVTLEGEVVSVTWIRRD